MTDYVKLSELIKETQAQQAIDDPVKEGYTRCYTDHTGRFYEDYPTAELNAPVDPDSIFGILQDEINKEIARELVEKLKASGVEWNPPE